MYGGTAENVGENEENIPRCDYTFESCLLDRVRGRGVLPYVSYISMCRCEGYGFQAVWSGIGYRNQVVLI